jgi:hypothetical protein
MTVPLVAEVSSKYEEFRGLLMKRKSLGNERCGGFRSGILTGALGGARGVRPRREESSVSHLNLIA